MSQPSIFFQFQRKNTHEGKWHKTCEDQMHKVIKKCLQTSRTNGSNSSLALRGTIKTFVGAMTGGNERTCNAIKVSIRPKCSSGP